MLAKHLNAAAVVQAEHGCHEMAERVVAEVGADVRDAQALAGPKARRRGVRQARHAQPERGLQAAVRVPAAICSLSGRGHFLRGKRMYECATATHGRRIVALRCNGVRNTLSAMMMPRGCVVHGSMDDALHGDGECQLRAEGVRHRVEGLHRRHPPRGQLAAHLPVQPHEQRVAVAPLAHALRMRINWSVEGSELQRDYVASMRALDYSSANGVVVTTVHNTLPSCAERCVHQSSHASRWLRQSWTANSSDRIMTSTRAGALFRPNLN